MHATNAPHGALCRTVIGARHRDASPALVSRNIRRVRALVLHLRPLRWFACRAAGFVTPAIYWSRLACLQLRDVPVPELPGDDWVRLRTIFGGVCGTDLMSVFQRGHPASLLRAFGSFPAIVGHENVSIVDHIGPGVRDFAPGERVCVEPSLSCVPRGIDPVCRPCAAGLFALCERVRREKLPTGSIVGMNRFTGGSWGSYFVAHRSQLHRVPPDIDDRTAVLTDPIACSLHAVLRRRPLDDERVLVIGSGIIALGVVACLRAVGCRAIVTAIVRRPSQAERMSALGADRVLIIPAGASNGQRYDVVASDIGGRRVQTLFDNQAFIGGYDVVYDCVGSGSGFKRSGSLTDALKFTRARGTVILVGTSQIGWFDTTPLWFKELTVLGASGRQYEDFEGRRMHTYEAVFELVCSGRLNLSGLLTHTFPINRYRDAFRLLARRGAADVVKVAFQHEASA